MKIFSYYCVKSFNGEDINIVFEKEKIMIIKVKILKMKPAKTHDEVIDIKNR